MNTLDIVTFTRVRQDDGVRHFLAMFFSSFFFKRTTYVYYDNINEFNIKNNIKMSLLIRNHRSSFMVSKIKIF